jgi:thiol-disulfide isomerase/thioredoxin
MRDRLIAAVGFAATLAVARALAGSHAPEPPRKLMDPLLGEFMDSMPVYGMLPSIAPADVERWSQLGREASRCSRAGDVDGVAAAYRAQIGIYRLNPDPYVALAMLEAGRGNDKAALEHLRAAVARGFTDFSRLARAEAAARLRNDMGLFKLEAAMPDLRKAEEEFAGWDSFHYARSREPSEVLQSHGMLHERIALIAPVLGERQVRLWNRLVDRSTAAELEVYIAQNKEAADVDDVLARLMAIYAQRPVLRWEILPTTAARKLSDVASIVLARGADHALRPGALTCAAVAQNANRDAKSVLRPAAATWIRSALAEVLSRYPSSDFAPLAATGLIRTEAEMGNMPRASEVYAAFRAANAGAEPVLDQMRDELGVLALRAGGMPPFRVTALDGTVLTPDALLGRVAVLDFWTMSCRACVEGFDTLRRLETTYGERIAVVGVSFDAVPEEDLRAWIVAHKVPGRQVKEGSAWDSELVEKFGIADIPFRVVVGTDGKVLAVNEHGKRLEKAVAAALGRK